VPAAAGAGAAGWGNTSDPVGSFGNSQFGGNAGNLAQSGALSDTPAWLQTAQQYAEQAGGLLGGGQGGQQMPVSMGNMFGSSAPPQQQQQQRQPQLLDMSQRRFKGYARTPIQFRGSTIWL